MKSALWAAMLLGLMISGTLMVVAGADAAWPGHGVVIRVVCFSALAACFAGMIWRGRVSEDDARENRAAGRDR